MKKKFYVSASPHIHENVNIKKVMWSVVIALIPALVAAYIVFGIRAIWLTMLGIVSAVVTEAIIQYAMKKPITISDGSAVITGMLVSYNLSSNVSWWIPVIGSVFAIGIGKQMFGGLGFNPFNPALLARAFLMASWPTQMTAKWLPTKFGSISGLSEGIIQGGNIQLKELITSATPLNVAKTVKETILTSSDPSVVNTARTIFHKISSLDTISNLFWGNVGGCIGEVSAAALLLGAAYLAYHHYIGWRIPIGYIGTVAILGWIFGGINGLFTGPVLFHIFSGGLILGAFFMATDMVTSPVTKKGRLIFGIGCGVITIIIRLIGGYPEGVSYSILLMNITVPLIDRYTTPKTFGLV